MRRVTKAVMNCTKSQYNSVQELAVNVKAGITANATLFPGTTAALTTLGTDLTLLTTLIGTARGNHTIMDQRNIQSAKVFGDLQILLVMVNTVATGNRATIDLSGFPTSVDPAPQAIPDQVIIKKVVKADTELSAKVILVSLGQKNLMYTVRTTTVAGAAINDPSWVTVLQTRNSRRLILSGLVRHQEIYISVCAANARGTGIYSDAMSYSA